MSDKPLSEYTDDELTAAWRNGDLQVMEYIAEGVAKELIAILKGLDDA